MIRRSAFARQLLSRVLLLLIGLGLASLSQASPLTAISMQDASQQSGPLSPSVYLYVPQTTLNGSDSAAYDSFGMSVALDQSTALVGAPHKMIDSNENQGVAYVFFEESAGWVEQAVFRATDGAANDRFGGAVAVSVDTAVVGAPNAKVSGNESQGAAYVFVRAGTTWLEPVKLMANDGAANDWFGATVAIAEDTIVVGAPLADVDGKVDAGAAYTFIRVGTTWTQQMKLAANDSEAGDRFGASVAFDGSKAVLGAPRVDSGTNTDRGAAYVFTYNGINWTQQVKLTGPGGRAGDRFGSSVAIAGNTTLIGASLADVNQNSDAGAAYVFVDDGTTWIAQGQLTASDGAVNDHFGVTVALDDVTVLVGAADADVEGDLDQGAIYAFVWDGASWIQQAKVAPREGTRLDNFSSAVALSGGTLLAGALGDDVDEREDQGTASIYERVAPSAWHFLPVIMQ